MNDFDTQLRYPDDNTRLKELYKAQLARPWVMERS